MGRRTVILALVPALTACGASVAASASPTPPPVQVAQCGPRAAPTLAASRSARVYLIHRSVYGCSSGSQKAFRLGGRSACLTGPLVERVRVAGKIAAYGLQDCGVDTAITEVVVRRLTDGKQLRMLPATGQIGVEAFQSVMSLVLESDGAVAWIGVVSSVQHPRAHIEVHRADSRGGALLDAGGAIKPQSMQLHGSTVTWRDGSAIRSAPLH